MKLKFSLSLPNQKHFDSLSSQKILLQVKARGNYPCKNPGCHGKGSYRRLDAHSRDHGTMVTVELLND